MLSKNQIKDLCRYGQKKIREEENVFIAEGPKLVQELLTTFKCHTLVALPNWIDTHTYNAERTLHASQSDLERISLLKSPNQVFALFYKPQKSTISTPKGLSLALDGIQDPGNLGTIIRIADWFGIEEIYCSSLCADAFSPKVVQATMGALTRVQIFQHIELPIFLQNCNKQKISVYGTFLEGKNIYAQKLTSNGVIVIGNEGNGISPEVASCITKKIHIPSFPPLRQTSESLNAATATAIVCAEFRRQYL